MVMDAQQGYNQIKQRLDEILLAVQDKDISLDDALTYYEEAVNLGLAASKALDDPVDEQEADALASSQKAATEQADASQETLSAASEMLQDSPLAGTSELQMPAVGSDAADGGTI